ncbi:uncharacterized protein LOC136759631 isoform X2 [Amia ocellicauda]|uniref:uncharacterized protein LOC136759631 isoform X2 n=1 Tax=Amia ocellicauda TaxID=2972642 RepID=UPI00346401CD
MLCRNILIVLSLAILLVNAEPDLDGGSQNSQAMSTDQDSTSDEVPTESMNSISADRSKDKQYYLNGWTGDASSISSEVSEHLPSNEISDDGINSSIEDQDDDQNSSSDEKGKH